MTTKIGERQEDFIAQLQRLINEHRQDEAIDKITSLNTLSQFDTLFTLLQQSIELQTQSLQLSIRLSHASAVAIVLTHTGDLAGVSDLSRVRAHDLAYVMARKLTRIPAPTTPANLPSPREVARDLARILARDLSRVLDNNLVSIRARDLALAHNLARDLAFAQTLDYFATNDDFDLIHDLAKEILFMVYDIPSNHDFITKYQQKLADSLDEALWLYEQNPTPLLEVVLKVIQKLGEGNLRHITLEGLEGITPDNLVYQIGPFLQSMRELQQVHTEITGQEVAEFRIVQIHNSSPKVEISAGEGTLETFNNMLSFRKRNQEAELRDLEIEERRLAIEERKLEIEARKLEIISSKRDIIKRDLELEEKQLEILQRRSRIKLEMRRAYLDEAEAYLEKFYPHLSDKERLAYIPRVANALMVMNLTQLELRIGWHDKPRTLPEQK